MPHAERRRLPLLRRVMILLQASPTVGRPRRRRRTNAVVGPEGKAGTFTTQALTQGVAVGMATVGGGEPPARGEVKGTEEEAPRRSPPATMGQQAPPRRHHRHLVTATPPCFLPSERPDSSAEVKITSSARNSLSRTFTPPQASLCTAMATRSIWPAAEVLPPSRHATAHQDIPPLLMFLTRDDIRQVDNLTTRAPPIARDATSAVSPYHREGEAAVESMYRDRSAWTPDRPDPRLIADIRQRDAQRLQLLKRTLLTSTDIAVADQCERLRTIDSIRSAERRHFRRAAALHRSLCAVDEARRSADALQDDLAESALRAFRRAVVDEDADGGDRLAATAATPKADDAAWRAAKWELVCAARDAAVASRAVDVERRGDLHRAVGGNVKSAAASTASESTTSFRDSIFAQIRAALGSVAGDDELGRSPPIPSNAAEVRPHSSSPPRETLLASIRSLLQESAVEGDAAPAETGRDRAERQPDPRGSPMAAVTAGKDQAALSPRMDSLPFAFPSPSAADTTEKPPAAASAPTATGRVVGDWKELIDTATRQRYFINVTTGETAWTVDPAEEGTSTQPPLMFQLSSAPAASRAVPAAITNASVIPPTTVSSAPNSTAPTAPPKPHTTGPQVKVASPPSAPAATATPALAPANAAPAGATTGALPGTTSGDWIVKLDAASRRVYYLNSATKKTTWKIEETPFAKVATVTTPPAARAPAAVTPAPGEIRGDWKAVLDASSGKLYFVNAKTKKTSWNIADTSFAGGVPMPGIALAAAANAVPTASVPSAAGDWKASTDPKSGRAYFVNVATKATAWTLPGGATLMPAEASSSAAGRAPPPPAKKEAVAVGTPPPPPGEPGTVKGDWKVAKDAATGRLYYVHMVTKKTTWNVRDTSFGR